MRILIFIIIIITACKTEKRVNSIEYFTNGNLKTKTFFGEDGKKTILKFYENRKDTVRVIVREENDSLSHVIQYYLNGEIKKQGKFYVDTLKVGKWSFFNEKGNLSDLREYFIVKGKSYLNQRWIFNSKGDTIGGNYFVLKNKDTVNKGEANRFHFFLKRPILSFNSESYILLPKKGQKMNKNLSNLEEISWDTIRSIGYKSRNNKRFKDRNHDVVFDVFSKEEGMANLTGVIVEKEISKEKEEDFVTRDLFFDISYYVKNK